jgi:hypothetical protein
LQPLGNEIQLLSTFWLVSVPAWPNDIGDRTMTMGIARLLLTSCFVLVLVPFAFAADDPFAEGSTWSGRVKTREDLRRLEDRVTRAIGEERATYAASIITASEIAGEPVVVPDRPK